MSDTVKRVLWTAAQAFLAAFLVLAAGIAQAPNLQEAKAALIAAVVAGVAAAVSAVKNLLFAPSSPAR
jgi:hypothetical protein